MIKINRNILKLRKQIGYTQEDLAHYLNLTKATISKWENDLSYRHKIFTSLSKSI